MYSSTQCKLLSQLGTLGVTNNEYGAQCPSDRIPECFSVNDAFSLTKRVTF